LTLRLTHRERILAAIRHEPVDRVPTDLWATPEVLGRLYREFGIAGLIELYDRLEIDGIIQIAPPFIGPAPIREGTYWEDYWGVGYRDQTYEGGTYPEFDRHPLAEAETIADLEAWSCPSLDWFDFSQLRLAASSAGGRAVSCGYSAVFHFHNKLRGLELSLMDPLLRPEFTHYLIRKITDFFLEYHRRCFEAAGDCIDLTEVTDDWGTQQGLLSSPQVFREFYRAPMLELIHLAQSHGIHVFHHDDGDIRSLLPDLVGLGIEVLNPIQWRCGNWNLAELKTNFGKRVCFHGGVDNQQTLPFADSAGVAREVEHLIRTLASDQTGFILAPCHNIQPNTSTENIVAMYEAARTYGTFEPRRRSLKARFVGLFRKDSSPR